jgi:hypothetical protein
LSAMAKPALHASATAKADGIRTLRISHLRSVLPEWLSPSDAATLT